MRIAKKAFNTLQKGWMTLVLSLLCKTVFAEDKLAGALGAEVKGTFGSDATFWSIFILIDIVLAAAMAIKTKNPMVFASVFFIAFIPGILIKAFVFTA